MFAIPGQKQAARLTRREDAVRRYTVILGTAFFWLAILTLSTPVGQAGAETGPAPEAQALEKPASVKVLPAARVRVHSAYGKVPLHFEANQGQTDPSVQFLSRGRGYTLFLTSTEAVLTLRKPKERTEAASGEPEVSPDEGAAHKSTVLRMRTPRPVFAAP